MNKRINVVVPASKKKSYPILIKSGLLSKPLTWLPKKVSNLVIITDNVVKKYYAARLVSALKKAGLTPLLLSFPAGERYKTAKTKQMLEGALLDKHFGRDSFILALGGGVVGDMAGFVASTYMRGIPYIQIPTSLLAMLDSSIGGKTGINTPHGKNLIGAFWQPEAVVIDTDCMSTLPKKHIINGALEALKIFLVSDVKAFQYFQENTDAILNADVSVLTQVAQRAINIKTDVVQQDEKEKYLRMILNFGHTIGHALEKESHYKMLHGVAVGYGMLVEAKIAQLLGMLKEADFAVIQQILAELSIRPAVLKKFSIEHILQHTKIDKKVKKGHPHYVLLNKLGSVYIKNQSYVHVVSENIIKLAFKEI